MKKLKLATLVFCLFMIFVITGCNTSNDYSDKIKVVFNLDGGIYKNSEKDVIHYYDNNEAGSVRIYDLETVTKKTIERPGYDLLGWETRTEVAGEIVKKDFDFEKDRVTMDGITLYAKWKKQLTYTYNLCYMDENNNKVSIYEYEVNSGDTFSDYLNKRNSRTGYTFLKFMKKVGDEFVEWDESFTHPGGDADLSIDVYADYIKGIYKLVYTAEDLKAAGNFSSIYLMNDIDMNGAIWSMNKYTKTFEGNYHTISNFVVKTGNTLCSELDFESSIANSVVVSIFNTLEKATIRNVTFDNVTFDVSTGNSKIKKVFVLPICGNATDSTIENVEVNGTYVVGKFYDEFNTDYLFMTTDKLVYNQKGSTTIVNTKQNINIDDNKEDVYEN